LAERDWRPVPLGGPEDQMEVLVPAFRSYLDQFGLAESCFEAGPSPGDARPVCRTRAGKLTGVALREGRGSLLFLPGDPRNRFLKFFSALGEALDEDRSRRTKTGRHIFAAERPLLRRREEVKRRLSQIERDLDRFRRRRDLMEVAETDLARHLPEWFSSFLKIELRPMGEAGLFRIEAPGGQDPEVKGLLAAAVRRPADHLLVLAEVMEQMAAQAGSTTVAGFLLLLGAQPESCDTGATPSGFDLAAEAAAAAIHLVTPGGLFRLLDRCDLNGISSLGRRDPVALLKEAVGPPPGEGSRPSGHAPSG
ncbi:MAG: hypothetical protein ACE5ID_05340, partial [Acidobacteriota bacterium]